MKTIVSVIILSLSLVSCATSKTSCDASWEAYCQAYNVNPSAPTEEEENYYLDCWAGSVEEEAALGL
ncbi:hypothetical protein [Lepagella muris]|jgi:hypothetical protein|uniref:Uncharacterized protein n=1 Tax=Lepagella muris TaxID=3032870 RepID=A0AC61RGQ2_9BACT|nr:hypothetical protein [Lepagella muris]TGY79043.1 hypothetical protein E5331_08240 [Lepagella muris]THG52484.1 hypothetical protein E5984_07515 [Bacteroidales bacterium]TKC54296.1 hypothetical protein E5359_019005 [Bacteroidales bacterium]